MRDPLPARGYLLRWFVALTPAVFTSSQRWQQECRAGCIPDQHLALRISFSFSTAKHNDCLKLAHFLFSLEQKRERREKTSTPEQIAINCQPVLSLSCRRSRSSRYTQREHKCLCLMRAIISPANIPAVGIVREPIFLSDRCRTLEASGRYIQSGPRNCWCCSFLILSVSRTHTHGL